MCEKSRCSESVELGLARPKPLYGRPLSSLCYHPISREYSYQIILELVIDYVIQQTYALVISVPIAVHIEFQILR